MNTPVPTTRDKHHRFPAEIISHAVWLDFRFCLSDRDVEALLFARGLKFMLLAALLYTPGTVLYIWARREQNTRVFKPAEVVIFLVAVVGALVCVYWLATGYITR
jgi:predicted membrane channel-forming protein YqfA (hemolysin III family)